MSKKTSKARRLNDRLARFRKYRDSQMQMANQNIPLMSRIETDWQAEMDAIAATLLEMANAGDAEALKYLKRNGYELPMSN